MSTNLADILRQQAEFLGDDVDVDVDYFMGTVSITAPGQDDIFLQGEDAEAFIRQVEETWERVGTLPTDVVERAQAATYAECIWN